MNAQATQIYEKLKKKEKMSKDLNKLNEIKEIGKKMEASLEYFYQSNLDDPTSNFNWEYILIERIKKLEMPGVYRGKSAVYTNLDVTKNTNGLLCCNGP